MLGLAVAQTILGDPLSALLTVAVFILNVIFNAIQQLYATGRVEKLLDEAQPAATAIREGQIRRLAAGEIVVGDVLVVGPGDEFLANGEILSGRPEVLEAELSDPGDRSRIKDEGSAIEAGSYCVNGRAVYKATSLPESLGVKKWTPVQAKTELTPLQRIIARVLRFLLGLIAFFLLLLALDFARFPIITNLFEADFRETASVFFSIAPSGLYFMIVATYALGSARLADLGALIRDSRAVESLAQVTVLCFSKTGTLTGAEVELEFYSGTDEHPALAESRIRQILGDVAHTFDSRNVFLEAIAENLPGDRRQVEESASFLSAYGWGGVTFSEADVRGTYIIGDPSVLEPYLSIGTSETGEEAQSGSKEDSWLRSRFGRLGPLFQRRGNDLESEAGELESTAHSEETAENGDDTTLSGAKTIDGQAVVNDGNIFQQLRTRSTGDGRANVTTDNEAGQVIEDERDRSQMVFAYSPTSQPLYDENGLAQLPDALTRLCVVSFSEQVRPEAREAIQVFVDSGVKVKILSSDEPEYVLHAAEEIGLYDDGSESPSAVSGYELAGMGDRRFEETVAATSVFGLLTSEQKGQIVRTLLRMDERVAMVGDGVEDVSAMEGANLSITMQKSSQATLGIADIVLLKDSLEVLPTVLDRGQRVVNGMLDILKINLVQIGYVLLLIVAMFIQGRRVFYYHPTQGGVIVFFTVIVPSVGLTFWASSGAVPRQYMRSRMAHFVVPGAITMAIAALVVSIIFGQDLDNIAYSQLVVSHLLVVLGLLVIVFVQPPTRFWVGGDVLSGDWRNAIMAFVLLLVFILATILPLTQELLRLITLNRIQDYLIIGGIALVWLFIVRAIWRSPRLSRYVGIMSERLVQT
jgi:magnesium-transporting ATPase (P-type)